MAELGLNMVLARKTLIYLCSVKQTEKCIEPGEVALALCSLYGGLAVIQCDKSALKLADIYCRLSGVLFLRNFASRN